MGSFSLTKKRITEKYIDIFLAYAFLQISVPVKIFCTKSKFFGVLIVLIFSFYNFRDVLEHRFLTGGP